MTTAEKSTRKKIRVSIIDVLTVLAIIAGIAGTFLHYKIYEKNNAVVTDDRAVISILFAEEESAAADKVKVGDKLFFGEGQLLGTVVEVSAENAEILYTDSNGKLALRVDEEAKDLTVLIEVNGEFTSGGFLARGTDYIAAGAELSVFSTDFLGNGLIFDVKKQAE